MPAQLVDALKPEYVAPLVSYLCHESTTENGGVFEVGAGFIGKLRWERTQGHFFDISGGVSAEDIRNNWSAIVDFGHSTHPSSMKDSTTAIMAGLSKKSSAPAPKQAAASSDSPVAAIFADLEKKIKANSAALISEINGTFVFVVGSETWVVDLTSGSPKAGTVSLVSTAPKAATGVTITVAPSDFVDLMTGKANATTLWSTGKVQLDGNMPLAMKLSSLTKGNSKL